MQRGLGGDWVEKASALCDFLGKTFDDIWLDENTGNFHLSDDLSDEIVYKVFRKEVVNKISDDFYCVGPERK